MSDATKYSLWLTPGGETGNTLRTLIEDIAAEYDAPEFLPHMTIVANILPSESQMPALRAKITQLTRQLSPFTVTLSAYGYKNETFRCLYLVAEAPQLTALYQKATAFFPQVATEHFAALPHISLVYSDMAEPTKQDIIAAHPITPLTFTADALELHQTNDLIETWRAEFSSPFGG